MMPVVDADPTAPSALPTPDSYEFFSRRTRAPSWKNEVTLRTIEMFQGYEPGEYLKRISPTPLLMVVAPTTASWRRDRLRGLRDGGAPEEARARAGRPLRRLRRPGFEISSGAARDCSSST